MRALFLSSMLIFAGCAPSMAQAQPTNATEAPRSERPLVFVLTTGLEDAQSMSSVFRHARGAARDGRLNEVAIIVYGRAIQAFDGTIQSRPAGLTESIRAAMDANVKIYLCAQAMERMGIAHQALDPVPTEVVPNAITKLIDYVIRDAAVVRY